MRELERRRSLSATRPRVGLQCGRQGERWGYGFTEHYSAWTSIAGSKSSIAPGAYRECRCRGTKDTLPYLTQSVAGCPSVSAQLDATMLNTRD